MIVKSDHVARKDQRLTSTQISKCAETFDRMRDGRKKQNVHSMIDEVAKNDVDTEKDLLFTTGK